jgi:cellulose biosynthesis protein BcsQ
LGERVLLLDLDPQGNATFGLGLDPDGLEGKTAFDVLMSEPGMIELSLHDTSHANLVSEERLLELEREAFLSLLGEEKQTNPFLRADDPAIAKAMNLQGAPASEVFGALRKAKDNF